MFKGDALTFRILAPGVAAAFFVLASMLFATDRLVPSQYGSIEDAIDDSVDGDTIIAELGTYNENLDFRGRSITLTSTDPNDPNVVAGTIIHGNGLIATVTFPDSWDANYVLTGFTITGGETAEFGGGVRCSSGTITISKCIFVDNIAENGGGIYSNSDFGHLTVTDCTFNGNVAVDHMGGGIYGYRGDLTVSNCTFNLNSANQEGGALASNYNNTTVTNCTFRENSAQWGGAIHSSHFGATVKNCLFIGNSAQDGGGVCTKFLYLQDLRISNCTFHLNSADGYGGALCIRNLGDKSVYDVTLTNCILWDNIAFEEGPQVALLPTTTNASISYSCLHGDDLDVYDPSNSLNWLSGNIDSDPCFADQTSGDYHLKSTAGRWDPNTNTWAIDDQNSPCIDTGDPNSEWTPELWTHGKRINMGAFGGTHQASMSTSTAGNIADLNHNGSVFWTDLKILTGKWPEIELLLAEDLNRDGIVNSKDYAIFANNWRWNE